MTTKKYFQNLPPPVQKNKGGRPRNNDPSQKAAIERRVDIACKRLSQTAVAALEKVLKDPKAQPREQLKAAEIILNRAWGKPRQQIDQTITVGGGDALVEAMNKARQRVVENIVQAPLEVSEETPAEDAQLH